MNAVGGAVDPRARGSAERARTLYYIAAAVLAALVPLVLFAGFWVRTVIDQGEQDLRAFLVSRAQILSGRLDAEIRQQFSIMQAVASVMGPDDPGGPGFQATASRIAQAYPHWVFMAVVDPATGQPLAIVSAPPSSELPPLRADLARQVAQTRRPALATRYPGEGGASPEGLVFLAAPVVRDDAVRSVLVVGLKAQAVQGVVEQMGEEALLSVVIDDRSRILARSQGLDRFLGQEANTELRQATAAGEGGLFAARTLDDREVFTAFHRSPLTGWRAVAATERGRVDALGERSTWALVGTGAVSLTLAGVLAIFLFYSVVQRRVSDERLAASRALSALDARLLETTQDALAEQRKSAMEREVLLREIYHRVKNNLQIIQSLLRLGSRNLRPEEREPFEGAIRRVGAMARVHSLLYKSPDLASLDFKDYLEDLVKETADGFGADMRGVTTELDARSMRVPLDTAVPLAFITVEILTNAFKHAFPAGRRGRISVLARQEGGRGILEISDDGVGLPEEAGGRRSLGLNLVTKLVEQIGGNLETPAPGSSTYRVSFPLAPPPTVSLPEP